MKHTITLFIHFIFFIFLSISYSSFCMIQKQPEQTVLSICIPIDLTSDNFFTETLLTESISNQITEDYSFLRLTHKGPKKTSSITTKPLVFVVTSNTHIPQLSYSINPGKIETHSKDSDDNWIIKTTIKKYSEKTEETCIELPNTSLSKWLTDATKNRKSIKDYFVLDKYTQAKILAKGPILAECTTTLSPNEYIQFLQKAMQRNLLISKHNLNAFFNS